MLEMADQLLEWNAAGLRFALATVIETSASAPRRPGAALAVGENGQVLGSISGGCVEAATVALAESVLESGRPAREQFGITGGDAFEIGLTCGGTIEVFVEPSSPSLVRSLRTARRAARERRSTAFATVVAGHRIGAHFDFEHNRLIGSSGDTELDGAIAHRVAEALAACRNSLIPIHVAGGEPVTLFVYTVTPAPRMLIFGAVDFARALSQLGKLLGYHVTVCDARPMFATPARFPEADEVVVDWPHRFLDTAAVDERSVLCVLTHDPKFDIPLLERALQLPVAYVGAMGSRQVCTMTTAQLRACGTTPEQLARMHAPIGLDIGGSTPMETAVSIAAEIIAARENRNGLSLAVGTGPIHPRDLGESS